MNTPAKTRLRVLVISNNIPRPDTSAGERRLLALIEMLARHHDVDFCSTYNELKYESESNPDIQRYRRLLEATGANLIESEWRALPAALAQNRYDVAIIEFYSLAARYMRLLRFSQPGMRIIIDSVDVHFAREAAAAELGLADAAAVERTKKEELATYSASDAVIGVSSLDVELLNQQADMPPLYLLPIIMAARIREVAPRDPECLFIGGFRHPPNIDGLLWFCETVWPRVREQVADATLTVIGSYAPPEIQALAPLCGIRMLGFVEDTTPYLDRAAVSIAPLRYGAGMKGKVMEALAWGLPVVTTAVGAQGLEVISGQELALAEKSPDFAKAVVDLLQNPAQAAQMGLRGQSYIAGVCSPEVVEATMQKMLNEVVPVSHGSTRPLFWLRWKVAAIALSAVNFAGAKWSARGVTAANRAGGA